MADLTSAVDVAKLALIKSAFQAAYGADYESAFATGMWRAENLDWSPDQGNEGTDLAAVVVASLITGRNASANGDHNGIDGLLDRTWVVLAHRGGYKDGDHTSPENPAQANLILVLGAIIIVAEAALIAYVLYRVTMLVNNVLAQHEASREMMQAHSDAMQIIEAHRAAEQKAGHAIPYDAGEMAILASLQEAQDRAERITESTIETTKGGGPGAAPVEVGAGLVLGLAAAAGLAYLLLAPKR